MNNFFIILYFSIFSAFSQQTDIVDFLKIEASVTPNSINNNIEGHVLATFKVLKVTDSIFMDAVNIEVRDIKTKNFQIIAEGRKLWFVGNFEKTKTYLAEFWYTMKPKQTLYFFGNEIWTQGQGKYTSHWLPSIDDLSDKIEFDLQIIVPKNKAVIANGKLVTVENVNDVNAWRFDLEHPMSSYLAAFAVGNFDKKELSSASGIPIQLYYKPEDSPKFEPTYRYSRKIFDFLEIEIGVPFPWQNYKQVPVRDFLYAGMENTTATFFSEAFMVDSIGFNDRNYINVNAHELAHQWFGDCVTETSGADHWLQEGFASYYAMLAEREIFGDDYYYWKLFQSAEQLKELSDEGKGESVLNPKASSLTFYEKGAWALHILKEQIGEEAFKIAIKNYLEKHKYQNVTTQDFLNEVKQATTVDVSGWEDDWLKQSAFKAEAAYNSLMRSTFIQSYFEISALRAIPLAEKRQNLMEALEKSNDFIGQEVIAQLAGLPITETLPLFKKAFETNNLFIRQAIAGTLQPIPLQLQPNYETLLDDHSYLTKEIALYNLWSQFPENRKTYLDKLKGSIGFQDKNVRQLWLALALVTESYEPERKNNYLTELKEYSSQKFSFEIRKKAFEYINELKLWDTTTLQHLAEACAHPNWRFAKSSMEMLKKQLENEEYKRILIAIKSELSSEAQEFLSKTITQ